MIKFKKTAPNSFLVQFITQCKRNRSAIRVNIRLGVMPKSDVLYIMGPTFNGKRWKKIYPVAEGGFNCASWM